MLRNALGTRTPIVFNNVVPEGDLCFYHADINRAMALGWRPTTSFEDGVKNYFGWPGAHGEAALD
jgi:nucleoside-diphosphate-sugar epimerase